MLNKRIYLSPPHMVGNEKKLLDDAFNSNWIAPLGPDVDAFEKEISEYLGVQYGCALSSGTAALHLSLKVLGISGGDTVLCPSLTFSATANVLIYEKAIPVFIDVDPKNWTIDIRSLEKAIKKYKPKALITVDIYGHSCDYDIIYDLCDQYDIALIEDAAEALGSEYKGRNLGSFGEMGIISFNGNKIITTSGGGMLVSNNEDFVTKARFLASQAREAKIHYEHKELGYNYRMSNLLAALGRGQLLNINRFVRSRRNIYNRYYKAFENIEGFEFMTEEKYCRSNRWLSTLLIDESKAGINRDKIINELEIENIESRPVWKPMHLQPFYKGYDYIKNNNTDVSAKLFNNGICLPSGSNLSKSDQNRIIDIIISLTKN